MFNPCQIKILKRDLYQKKQDKGCSAAQQGIKAPSGICLCLESTVDLCAPVTAEAWPVCYGNGIRCTFWQEQILLYSVQQNSCGTNQRVKTVKQKGNAKGMWQFTTPRRATVNKSICEEMTGRWRRPQHSNGSIKDWNWVATRRDIFPHMWRYLLRQVSEESQNKRILIRLEKCLRDPYLDYVHLTWDPSKRAEIHIEVSCLNVCEQNQMCLQKSEYPASKSTAHLYSN